ncbi:hypothetical protein LFL96_36780 (plasmid) [Paraburkholderia sp. D15]|uniref:DUF7706 family protein n=1 Tax=Paraburkholderia sp. D15 TaxID=2880218 RepID=UPI00247895F0|nr:hypothetical protein [Paraburkholderia sp. D15]WGS55034.1 hypothetical protein LFL96_36780 [Paraburkholderia sp. D15]
MKSSIAQNKCRNKNFRTSKVTLDGAGRDNSAGVEQLSEAEAVPLAQLCKRMTFSDIRSCSFDVDEA